MREVLAYYMMYLPLGNSLISFSFWPLAPLGKGQDLTGKFFVSNSKTFIDNKQQAELLCVTIHRVVVWSYLQEFILTTDKGVAAVTIFSSVWSSKFYTTDTKLY